MKQLAFFLLAFALIASSPLSAQSRAVADGGTAFAGASGAPASFLPLVPDPVEERMVQENIKDIHFDFNRSNLRPEDRSILESDAQWLKANPNVIVTIEGDADERGDIPYNVVLSQQRATTAKDALVAMGVPSDQVVYSTGWGKLYPVCTDADETCWSENRRAHFEAW